MIGADKFRVAIVANCHAVPIGAALRCAPAVQVKGVADINVATSAAAVMAAITKAPEDYDAIISYRFGPNYPLFETAKLRGELGDKLHLTTNVYFGGLHPDLCYAGSFAGRMPGALGDYHSRIAMIGFTNSLPAAECVSLFNGRTYEALGYLDAYAEAERELRRRDEDNQIKFADRYIELVRHRLCLLTANHPTGVVFGEYAEAIAAYFNLRHYRLPVEMVGNPLANSACWPIYPEIREALRLPYETPMVFVPPIGKGLGPMTLPEFVDRSYAIYARIGLAELEKSTHFQAARKLLAKLT
ncbi:hypothetical protein ASG40_11700 [Methylobacterium sp. Leaf399]|nr:hypothetical protein ASG40_11700 [Methylobacterium sp. Leaf399]